MRVVYIAGPFRAINGWEIEKNVRRAEAMALQVWQLGAAALCPHLNSRFFQGSMPEETFLQGGLELLIRSDAVLVVPGFELSKGTKRELEVAAAMNKPVFHSLDKLDEWLRNTGALDATDAMSVRTEQELPDPDPQILETGKRP